MNFKRLLGIGQTSAFFLSRTFSRTPRFPLSSQSEMSRTFARPITFSTESNAVLFRSTAPSDETITSALQHAMKLSAAFNLGTNNRLKQYHEFFTGEESGVSSSHYDRIHYSVPKAKFLVMTMRNMIETLEKYKQLTKQSLKMVIEFCFSGFMYHLGSKSWQKGELQEPINQFLLEFEEACKLEHSVSHKTSAIVDAYSQLDIYSKNDKILKFTSSYLPFLRKLSNLSMLTSDNISKFSELPSHFVHLLEKLDLDLQKSILNSLFAKNQEQLKSINLLIKNYLYDYRLEPKKEDEMPWFFGLQMTSVLAMNDEALKEIDAKFCLLHKQISLSCAYSPKDLKNAISQIVFSNLDYLECVNSENLKRVSHQFFGEYGLRNFGIKAQLEKFFEHFKEPGVEFVTTRAFGHK